MVMEVLKTELTIAVHEGLYLANIIALYVEPHTLLTIALLGGLYLVIIMGR
jgi:hypothetical protein